MASKFNSRRTGPNSPSTSAPADTFPQSCHAQIPPPLSGSSPLLASVINLPVDYHIAYAVFVPRTDHISNQIHTDLEHARLSVISRATQSSFLDSLFPFVHLSKESHSLWVFSFGNSADTSEHTLHKLHNLSFDHLTLDHISKFAYKDLYPCSLSCSFQRDPCPSCITPPVTPFVASPPTNAQSNEAPTSPRYTGSVSLAELVNEPPSARLLPRQRLRGPYNHFIDAIRDYLIDEMSNLYKIDECAGYIVQRFRHGFLIPQKSKATAWNAEWEHYDSRSLTFCDVSPTLIASHILVNFKLQSTTFLPISPSYPLPNGAPIVLLPQSIPAYYLSTYRGPVSALTKQFDESLRGLGAGDWTGNPFTSPGLGRLNGDSTNSNGKCPQFIIAWLSVQNKRGEDKGITIIWPARLCVSFTSEPFQNSDGHLSPVYAHGRHLLTYIPELPAPLQSSPVPAPATVSTTRYAPMDTTSPYTSLATPIETSASKLASTPRSPSVPVITNLFAEDNLEKDYRHSGTTFNPDAVKVFRALVIAEVPSVSYGNVAGVARGYVDFVAKERERERERIKREREAVGQSPKLLTLSGNPNVQQDTSSLEPTDSLDNNSDLMNQPSSSLTDQNVTKTEHSEALDITMQSLEPEVNVPVTMPNTVVSLKMESQPAMVSAVNNLTSLGFDTFNNPDSSWMDLDMSFPAVAGLNGEREDPMNLDNFGVFTDDDFSFFDGPTRAAPGPPTPPTLENSFMSDTQTGLTPAAGPALLGLSPSIFGVGDNSNFVTSSGFTPAMSHPSPWLPHSLTDAFSSPTFASGLNVGDDIANGAELFLPRTPPYSEPATPNIQVVEDAEIRDWNSNNASTFKPVPFAASHRVSDNKYSMGKFALPSPPDEEDRTTNLNLIKTGSWKGRYNSITDPRLSIIKKLADSRKVSRPHTSHSSNFLSSSSEFVDWLSSSPEETDDQAEEGSDDDNPWTGEEDVVMVSRPSTPIPSYVPLGSSLISTHFLHYLLLPISTNLRPPNAAFELNDIPSAAAISVPTPVSPAAVLGAISEKTKSLEAAAQILCEEVVENSAWAEAWRTNAISCQLAAGDGDGSWLLDLHCVRRLILLSNTLGNVLDLKSFFELVSLRSGSTKKSVDDGDEIGDELKRLEMPSIIVGKSGSIIQALPSVTRFWDKLGLTPRSGPKDVTVFILFEDKAHHRLSEIEDWLHRLSTIYKGSGYGNHIPGQSSACTKDGILPVRFDAFRKSLGAFVPSIVNISGPILLYIVTPSSILSLASTVLRQVFSAVRRARQNYSDKKIFFRFVPEYLVDIAYTHPSGRQLSLRALITSVYDLIRRPVLRSMSRPMFMEEVHKDFDAPAFTLGRNSPQKAKFLFQHSRKVLGVTDYYTFLHIGYCVTPSKKWITAACVDERGTMHQLRVWLTQDDFQYSQVVSQVWEFAMDIAQKANIEWRLVIAKLGLMDQNELDAWASHLTLMVSTGHIGMNMHVSVVSVEQDSAWTFTHPHKEKMSCVSADAPGYDKGGHGVFLAESTSLTYMLPPIKFCPIVPFRLKDSFLEHPFIPDDDESVSEDCFPLRSVHTSALLHVSSATPLSNVRAICIHFLHSARSPQSAIELSDKATHEDVTRNYHSLAFIARLRFGLKTEASLPFHLAALQVMQLALERSDTVSD